MKILLEDGLTTNGKLDDVVDIEGLDRAYDHLFDLFRTERESARLDAGRVACLHERLTKGLRVVPHAGQYREDTGASGRGAQEAVAALLEEVHLGDRHPVCQAALLCLGLDALGPSRTRTALLRGLRRHFPFSAGSVSRWSSPRNGRGPTRKPSRRTVSMP